MESELYTTGSIGRNIEKIRKVKGMKQETLASALGISRQAVSKLEQASTIDDEKLKSIANALNVSIDDIKNFSEDSVVYYTQNNYEGAIKDANNFFMSTNNDCSFNVFDKYVEAVEEIRKLYEQLLKAEREKNELLTKMLSLLQPPTN